MQMPGILASRIVVISGGASSANDRRVPRTPAAPAAVRLASKSRRLWMICTTFISSLQFRSIRARAACSRLEFALQLVEEAPVSAVGDEGVRARFDHADLVEPQREEPQRILGVELAPIG